jgi:hypothetical protein
MWMIGPCRTDALKNFRYEGTEEPIVELSGRHEAGRTSRDFYRSAFTSR